MEPNHLVQCGQEKLVVQTEEFHLFRTLGAEKSLLHELEKLEVWSEGFHLPQKHFAEMEYQLEQGRPQALVQLALAREEHPLLEQWVSEE